MVSSFFSVVSGFLSVVTGALTVVSGFFSVEGSALFLWEITDMLIRIARKYRVNYTVLLLHIVVVSEIRVVHNASFLLP